VAQTGQVVDNIAALEVLLYDGTRFWCGPTSDQEYAAIERRGDQRARIYRRLRELGDTYAHPARRRLGPRLRQSAARPEPASDHRASSFEGPGVASEGSVHSSIEFRCTRLVADIFLLRYG
jgi:hypothetical protein